MENYVYHIFYVDVLSKNICGKMRSEGWCSVTGDILSIQNYVELLFVHFNLEIQSDHFGNGRFLSIEGCNIEFIDEDHNAYSEFYFHFSDDSR